MYSTWIWGSKKRKKFVHYNGVFVITKFGLSKLNCKDIFCKSCFFAGGSCKCGGLVPTKRIEKGFVVQPHSIPFQARLRPAMFLVDEDVGAFCGGSLISPNFVLTGLIFLAVLIGLFMSSFNNSFPILFGGKGVAGSTWGCKKILGVLYFCVKLHSYDQIF
jgi:hypothetical protein